MAPPVRRKKPVSHRGDGARDRIVAAALEALVEGDGEFEIGTGRRGAVFEMAALNVAQGQRRGFIAADIDPNVAAAAIIGGINQAVAQAISSRRRPASDQLAERLWSFIAGGLSLEQQAK